MISKVKNVRSSTTPERFDGPTYSSLTLSETILEDKDRSIIVCPPDPLTLSTV
jgi:hypothetical protein